MVVEEGLTQKDSSGKTFVPMMERMSEMTARTERETLWKTPGSLPSVYHFSEETVVP